MVAKQPVPGGDPETAHPIEAENQAALANVSTATVTRAVIDASACLVSLPDSTSDVSRGTGK